MNVRVVIFSVKGRLKRNIPNVNVPFLRLKKERKDNATAARENLIIKISWINK